MRIIKYTVHLDTDRKPTLVQKETVNCPNICKLDRPLNIANMMNIVYNANALTEEYVWLLALDIKCNPIGVFEVSHGTVSASLISPREIFIRLCLCGAAGFVLVHNHTSGEVAPSAEDTDVTTKIQRAGELMGINLLDHIIVGNEYYSFREEGFVFNKQA